MTASLSPAARHALAVLRRRREPMPFLNLAIWIDGGEDLWEAEQVVAELEDAGLVSRETVWVSERRTEEGVAVTDAGRRVRRWRRCSPTMGRWRAGT